MILEQLTVITRKGQITIPAAIRKTLGLKEGDKVLVSLSDEQTPMVTITPVRSVAAMTFGSVPPRQRPEDFTELRRLFEAEVAEQAIDEGQSTMDRA